MQQGVNTVNTGRDLTTLPSSAADSDGMDLDGAAENVQEDDEEDDNMDVEAEENASGSEFSTSDTEIQRQEQEDKALEADDDDGLNGDTPAQDDEDEEEEEDDDIKPAGQRRLASNLPSVGSSSALAGAKHSHAKRANDVVEVAELDPDLYGLRRSGRGAMSRPAQRYVVDSEDEEDDARPASRNKRGKGKGKGKEI